MDYVNEKFQILNSKLKPNQRPSGLQRSAPSNCAASDENHKELDSRHTGWIENQMHDHVDTKRARCPLLTLLATPHLRWLLLGFSLQRPGFNPRVSTNLRTVVLYRNTSTCPAILQLLHVDRKIWRNWQGAFSNFPFRHSKNLGFFYLLSNTVGNPWTTDKHQVSGIFYLSNTPTNANIWSFNTSNLKFTLKHLKRSYMFRSYDHPQGAYFVPC